MWLCGGEAEFFFSNLHKMNLPVQDREGAVHCAPRMPWKAGFQCAVLPLLLPSLVNASTPPPSPMTAGFVSLILAWSSPKGKSQRELWKVRKRKDGADLDFDQVFCQLEERGEGWMMWSEASEDGEVKLEWKWFSTDECPAENVELVSFSLPHSLCAPAGLTNLFLSFNWLHHPPVKKKLGSKSQTKLTFGALLFLQITFGCPEKCQKEKVAFQTLPYFVKLLCTSNPF